MAWVQLAGVDLWRCEVCQYVVDANDQQTRGTGPWCDLYLTERRTICRPMAKLRLRQADAAGDGPMVNALCALGRRAWGQDLDW